jgi:hypothetical protein
VRKLAPGTEVIVTVKGSPPGRRHFVAADKSDLTVLNVTDPMLSAAARDVLRGLTSNHPEYFPAAEKGGQFVLEKNVRLGPDGMFIADRKVTDLTQVIEHIARTDVAEITDPARARAGKGDPALLPLIFTLGGIAGAFIGAVVDGGPCSGVSNCASEAFPRGLFVGGLVGGVGAVALAHNALFSHKTDGRGLPRPVTAGYCRPIDCTQIDQEPEKLPRYQYRSCAPREAGTTGKGRLIARTEDTNPTVPITTRNQS